MNGQIPDWLLSDGTHLSPTQRAKHLHVIGQPGVGKSRALESWVMQDVLAGRGVGVIDPAGDLYDNLVARLALAAQKHPDIADRLILVDPSHPVWTVGFNPLEKLSHLTHEQVAGALADVIVKIWKMDEPMAPRTMLLLKYAFLVLSQCGRTLLDLPQFLGDATFRQQLLNRMTHRDVLSYFQHEFPRNQGVLQQWITPPLNRIRPLLFDPNVQLMLATASTINFRHIHDRQSILLVNLSKGKLGEGNSALLGAFIVAHLQEAALSRADVKYRCPFYLYLDEFQNYTTANIQVILSESRKYGLALILAHQYLGQLSTDLRDAVLNATATVAGFRVAYHDASVLVRDIFPPGSVKEWRHEVDFMRRRGLPFPQLRAVAESPTHEQLAAKLMSLRVREFWLKQRGAVPAVKCRTLSMPELPESRALQQLRRSLEDGAGQRFGRRKAEVRRKLDSERQDQSNDHSTTDYDDAD